MGPSGMPAAPEVSRLPPPGSQATEPGGGSGAERRGQGRHARTHTRRKLGQKELVEIWRNAGRARRSRGVQDAHANRGPAWAPATQWAAWIHSQHVFAHCLLRTFLLTTVVPYSRQAARWKAQKKIEKNLHLLNMFCMN